MRREARRTAAQGLRGSLRLRGVLSTRIQRPGRSQGPRKTPRRHGEARRNPACGEKRGVRQRKDCVVLCVSVVFSAPANNAREGARAPGRHHGDTEEHGENQLAERSEGYTSARTPWFSASPWCSQHPQTTPGKEPGPRQDTTETQRSTERTCLRREPPQRPLGDVAQA